ncbi:putative inner membrane protein [Planctomycetes bacterium Pan216]|uniref:Putative inner membrane protein n=1 Tax=Kolteria novifilia TaxID=2527975 RepID=A0A518BAB3_9BACT|nr:putative inner membrane protein [Planctomycetes bacterium Pan216]
MPESSASDSSSPIIKPGNVLPLLILLGVAVGFGVMFYQVIKPLLLPLFLAAVLALLIDPLYDWVTFKMQGRRRLAALTMTFAIVMIILGPLVTAIIIGASELYQALGDIPREIQQDGVEQLLDPEKHPTIAGFVTWLQERFSLDLDQARTLAIRAVQGFGDRIYGQTMGFLGDIVGFVVGSVMFVLAVYFFLVDGRKLIAFWEELTPMQPEHDRVLREEFAKVCRGVVWGTLISAIAQGLLFGFGFLLINLLFHPGLGAWIILLSLATVFFSMIPFLGAASVWVVVSAVMIYQGSYVSAACLIVYGATVVSSSDNIIRVWVLKDTVQLHPLLLFVCVIGGLQVIGFLGMFIGPIIGAVLFALLRILKLELIGPGVEAHAEAEALEEAQREAEEKAEAQEKESQEVQEQEEKE